MATYAVHSLFRRAKPPAPMPMLLLSFPGKKALRFEGDTSAAERDADLAVLMHAGKKAKAKAAVELGHMCLT